MAKVFTMPDVEVGSIIEYRYKLRYRRQLVPKSPHWYIQSDLWTRKGHYLWKPIDLNGNIILTGARGQTKGHNRLDAEFCLHGTEVKQSQLPGQRINPSSNSTCMTFLPPQRKNSCRRSAAFTYRVLFYYSAYRTYEEFWKNESKFWSKTQDKFIGPGPAVTAAVKDLVLPTDTPDQKLRKLYAAVMKLENTRFTRQHSTEEEKAQGFKEVHNTDDIWTRKRGSDDQLTAALRCHGPCGRHEGLRRGGHQSRSKFVYEGLSHHSPSSTTSSRSSTSMAKSNTSTPVHAIALTSISPGSTPRSKGFARPMRQALTSPTPPANPITSRAPSVSPILRSTSRALSPAPSA